jgi:multidrug efflux pump subunit AcrA (membrane-fusion protein)
MGQKGSFVFVYDPTTQRVKIKVIKVLDTINEMVVVESGLVDGEHVVVEGKIRLVDGGKAKISDDLTSVKGDAREGKHAKEANAINEKSRS